MSAKDQADSHASLKYAGRLAEERRSRFPHQGNFARLLGISQARQSLYERGERGISVEYLGALAEAGIDISYIVTGRRSTESLDETTSEIVSAVRALHPAQQHALLAFLATLTSTTNTVHARSITYEPEPNRTVP